MVADPAARAARPLAGWARARTWSQAAHLLTNLPLGIAWFTVAVTGLSTGVGLLVTLVGLPLLALTVLLGRVIAAVERTRAGLLGLHLPPPAPRRPADGLWRRTKAGLADGVGWRGLAYGTILLPWGVVTFTVVVTVLATAVFCVTLPTWGWAVALWPGAQVSALQRAGLLVASFAAGLGLLVAFPAIVGWLAAIDRWLARGLLGGGDRRALAERVTSLQVSLDASTDASASELRRIERDLHDGAQQRLVGLAMDLGLARERLVDGAEPAAVLELVTRAHDQSKQALGELRDLVRGIHPVVLTDRGLDAALSALASRSPVPVDMDVRLPVRPPVAVEATAYFVVAEALNNVAKHARAAHVAVAVHRDGAGLVVDVTDDGRGGAVIAPTGGLAGLRDRVVAAQGTLRISSPDGGPTTVHVEVPCAS